MEWCESAGSSRVPLSFVYSRCGVCPPFSQLTNSYTDCVWLAGPVQLSCDIISQSKLHKLNTQINTAMKLTGRSVLIRILCFTQQWNRLHSWDTSTILYPNNLDTVKFLVRGGPLGEAAESAEGLSVTVQLRVLYTQLQSKRRRWITKNKNAGLT